MIWNVGSLSLEQVPVYADYSEKESRLQRLGVGEGLETSSQTKEMHEPRAVVYQRGGIRRSAYPVTHF